MKFLDSTTGLGWAWIAKCNIGLG